MSWSLLAQPRLERFDQRPAALLADRATLLGGTAADLVLDPVEGGDARQRLGWRSAPGRLGQLVEVPTHVAPAEGKPHVALLGQHLVAAVAVDLQDAVEAGEMRDRPLGLAIRRVDVGDARRIACRPTVGRPGHRRRAGRSWSGRAPDRAPAPSSRRRTASARPSACRAAARARAAAGRRRARPSRPGSSDPGRCPGGRRSAPGDTAEGDRRTSTPAPGRRSPRSAARLRSAGPAPAPARPRPRKPGRRISAGAPPAPGTAPARCRAARRRPRRSGAASRRSTGRSVLLDIDHRLDARQVGRQRAAVRPTPGGARLRSAGFFCSVSAWPGAASCSASSSPSCS